MIVQSAVGEEESEVGGTDPVGGVEAEAFEHCLGVPPEVLECIVGRGVACLEVPLRLHLDLDELAEVLDLIERHGTAVDAVARPLLADGRRRLVPQAPEDRAHLVAVPDACLCLLARLGLVVDERPLVGDRHGRIGLAALRLLSDPQGFVGLREIAIRCVEIRVHLSDSPDTRRVDGFQPVADGSVVGAHLQLDLVHTRVSGSTGQKRPHSALPGRSRPVDAVWYRAGRPYRNGVLKSTTTDSHGMSNDSEAESEAAGGGDEEAEQSQEETGLQEDDFVLLDYTARTTDDGTLVDTTDPEVAEEEDVDADQEFAPRTIVLGHGHIFQSVEDDIMGREVGDTGTVTVPAEEAFGTYDEDEVRTISKDKIPEDERYPGAQVRIDGQEGFVETIIGGRARVDFNHPLAGDDIEYEYEVVDVVEDREEKASGLLDVFLDMDLNIWFQTDTVEEEQLVEPDEDEEAAEEEPEGEDADAESGEDAEEEEEPEPEPEFEIVEVEKDSLYIEATPELTMNQQWMMQKQQIGQQLIDLLGIDRIVVQETIDGSGMGMPGMMGGMGGMGGGGGDIEEALEEADIDADDLAEELE